MNSAKDVTSHPTMNIPWNLLWKSFQVVLNFSVFVYITVICKSNRQGKLFWQTESPCRRVTGHHHCGPTSSDLSRLLNWYPKNEVKKFKVILKSTLFRSCIEWILTDQKVISFSGFYTGFFFFFDNRYVPSPSSMSENEYSLFRFPNLWISKYSITIMDYNLEYLIILQLHYWIVFAQVWCRILRVCLNGIR
jgi:hypothetical protein